MASEKPLAGIEISGRSLHLAARQRTERLPELMKKLCGIKKLLDVGLT